MNHTDLVTEIASVLYNWHHIANEQAPVIGPALDAVATDLARTLSRYIQDFNTRDFLVQAGVLHTQTLPHPDPFCYERTNLL